MFLVRDWVFESHWKGFEGGKKLFEKMLNKQTESFDNIVDVFENTICFLLSHPGQKVAASQDSSALRISGKQ